MYVHGINRVVDLILYYVPHRNPMLSSSGQGAGAEVCEQLDMISLG